MFSHFRSADELMAEQEPDELPIQTDEACPFCGALVEWNGIGLYCEPCRRSWPDFHELRYDRNNVRYAATRAFMTQRDEDSDAYADTVGEGLARWTR